MHAPRFTPLCFRYLYTSRSAIRCWDCDADDGGTVLSAVWSSLKDRWEVKKGSRDFASLDLTF